ncbi:MAG: hypothetical protein EOO03_03125 [Chitinophagaceae bacterium]|nr:MAG: hypothetical protein EOO03_03125 [Chitinophagaceae bacterium]
MKKNSFWKNKYTVLLCILLLLLVADVWMHKGMARYLFPLSMPAQTGFNKLQPLPTNLIVGGTQWKKAVNSIEVMNALPANTAGLEIDVYFDNTRNNFLVYHDSSAASNTTLLQLLELYKKKNLSASLWLDFKNLSDNNQHRALTHLMQLRNQYNLQQKIIVESTHPQWLQIFNNANFFTSYYVPYFNPYKEDDARLVKHIDSIVNTLRQYNVGALSGYYFQLPALKKYFPSYPQLTWVAKQEISVVSMLFHEKITSDPSVKVVLQ